MTAPPPDSVTLPRLTTASPDEPSRVKAPAFSHDGPLMFSVSPGVYGEAIAAGELQLATEALTSSPTVLTPSTMPTLVLELFGTPDGFQCPAVFQSPLAASAQVESVPVSVHAASAGALEKAKIPKASAAGDAAASACG